MPGNYYIIDNYYPIVLFYFSKNKRFTCRVIAYYIAE